MDRITVWHVFAVAIILAIAAILTGRWQGTHYVLYLGALVLLGAILPIAGFAIGIIALIFVLFSSGLAGSIGGNIPGAYQAITAQTVGQVPTQQPKGGTTP